MPSRLPVASALRAAHSGVAGTARQGTHRDSLALVRGQPQLGADDARSGDAVEVSIGLRIRDDREFERLRVQLGDGVAAMATHVVGLAVDDLSRAAAGGLVVLHARENQSRPVPVDVVGHESGRDRLAQRLRGVVARVDDYCVPAECDDIELAIVG